MISPPTFTDPFTFPPLAMMTQFTPPQPPKSASGAKPVATPAPKTRTRRVATKRPSPTPPPSGFAPLGKSRVPLRRSARRWLTAVSPLKRSLLVGSSLLAGVLVILTGNLINPASLLGAKDPNAECQGKVQSQSVISRQQLGRVLTVAERAPKAKVREIVKAPFCTLPGVEIRAGIKAEREAYPLAFDPKTRLVILYEGDEYAGYAFDVRR